MRIAYRITGQLAEAEDVRQRVFLKLLEAPGAVRQPGQFAAWIHRAVVNTALSLSATANGTRGSTTGSGSTRRQSTNHSLAIL